jgi:malate dehydrogenase (quinone)
VQAMIEVLEGCFSEQMKTPEWQAKMKQMVPSYKQSLIEDEVLLKTVRKRTLNTLKLA